MCRRSKNKAGWKKQKTGDFYPGLFYLRPGNQYTATYSVNGGKLNVVFVQPPPNGVLVQCGVILTFQPQ